MKLLIMISALAAFVCSCDKHTTKPAEPEPQTLLTTTTEIPRVNHTTTFRIAPGCREVQLRVEYYNERNVSTVKTYYSRKDSSFSITTDCTYLNYIFVSIDKPTNYGGTVYCPGDFTLNGIKTVTTQANGTLNLYDR